MIAYGTMVLIRPRVLLAAASTPKLPRIGYPEASMPQNGTTAFLDRPPNRDHAIGEPIRLLLELKVVRRKGGRKMQSLTHRCKLGL